METLQVKKQKKIFMKEDNEVDIDSGTMIKVPVTFTPLQNFTKGLLERERASGKTFEDIAKVVGCAKGTVHKWLNATDPRPISAKYNDRILEAFLHMDPEKAVTIVEAFSKDDVLLDAMVKLLQ